MRKFVGSRMRWLEPETDAEAAQVVAIGNFDGVHLGHVALIHEAKEAATRLSVPCSVLTFDPHPSSVLGRGIATPLTTLEERCERLLDAGADQIWIQRFDAAFACLSSTAFVDGILATRLHAKACHVGANFRFGQGAVGDIDALRMLGESHGFTVTVAGLARDERGPFSSSRVRAALREGNTSDAAAVLGRPYAFSGRVVRGEQRGRTIGFPTANLGDILTTLPKRGVYAVRASKGVRRAGDPAPLRGVMNIGVRPTVSGEGRESVEVHLFDFQENLYGKVLSVEIVSRLRDEQTFPSFEALKAQIEIDARHARDLLAKQSQLA